MDDLILRVLSGEANDAERERLATWRARSPENDIQFQEWKRLWELSGLGAPQVTGESPLAADLIRRGEALRTSRDWTSAPDMAHPTHEESTAAEGAGGTGGVGGAGRGAAPAGRSSAPAGRPHRPDWMRWAAVLAALLVPAALAVGLSRGGAVGPWGGDHSSPSVATPSAIQVVTAPDESTTLDLSDGSVIHLGPNSRMEVSEAGDRTTIHLDGRAFFGVSPDASRRFVVTTPLGEAAVLGTRFEVRSEDEEFRVLVVEGAVQFSAGQGEAELRAGEMGRSLRGSPPTTSAVEDVAAQLDWLGNSLFFHDTPLTIALQEVEERFAVTIRLETPSLADQTVTASFMDQEAKEVMAVLCAIVGAQCRWEMSDEEPSLVEMGLPAGPAAEPEVGGSP